MVGAMLKKLVRKTGFDVIRNHYWKTLEGHVGHLLQEKEINVVIDVGANVGQFGTRIRQMGYKGLLLSFEPVKETFDKLAKAADGDKNWRCFEMALGDEEVDRPIGVTEGSSLSSFLDPNDYARSCFSDAVTLRKESVKVRRLDSIFDEITEGVCVPRAFLKLDTQGWDGHAFRGAKRCLGRVPLLQSELSIHPIYDGMEDWTGFVTLAKQEGFGLVGLYPVSYDARRRVIEYDGLFDCDEVPAGPPRR